MNNFLLLAIIYLSFTVTSASFKDDDLSLEDPFEFDKELDSLTSTDEEFEKDSASTGHKLFLKRENGTGTPCGKLKDTGTPSKNSGTPVPLAQLFGDTSTPSESSGTAVPLLESPLDTGTPRNFLWDTGTPF